LEGDEVKMADLLASMRATLERLREGGFVYETPWELLRRHTMLVDDLIQELNRDLRIGNGDLGMALVAVGGYGRRELTPWSDIDLMFLCQETSSQQLIQAVSRVLHALWNLHLEVGHSVRTVDDCFEVSLRDLRTWTAMMDARFVAGDQLLFDSFRKSMNESLFRDGKEILSNKLIQGLWERHRKYARPPFLVEPHLKEGPGGLRDIQSALWLSRCLFPVYDLKDLVNHALISQEEADEVQEAHTFLWRVRLQLHRLAKRKEDQLTFDMQERLAQSVPAEPDESHQTVEAFMRTYYRNATRIRYFAEDIIHKATDPSLASGPQGPTFSPEELGDRFLAVRGRLTLLDDRAFEMDPPRMMEAIAFAHRKGLDVDIFTRDQIKASVHLVDERFLRSRRVRDAFLSLLGSDDCGSKALELMHHLGLLQAYIPEFRDICFEVQHDAYHAYTVDFHSLEAVRELSQIREDRSNQKVVREIKQWPLLVLSVLLHDIGKGRGSGHAQRSAKLVDSVLRRWRLKKEDREHVVFLAGEHLLLMDTALGRDLTEERVIADLSQTVGTVKRLNHLYLLTLSDVKATGPELLTDWKSQLLRELYLKARHLLETGELVSPEAARRIEEARLQVSEGLETFVSDAERDRWVQSLPGRYLLTTPREDLVGQVLVAWEMVKAGERLRVVHRSREAYQEVVVCTWDAPALFSRICGVLVADGLNILGGRIHTWTNGVVMDTFQVEPLGGEKTVDAEYLERIGRDLTAVLEGNEDLDQLLSRRAPSLHLKRDRHPALKPRIKVDNRSSDFYTVVEVRARDRFGLLFALTHTLSGLGLDIHLALIDTRRGQVFDVFYVQETTGQKVWDEGRLALLERELYRTLERLEADDTLSDN
jgi:[protein-PII] uridylyltransferase